MRARVPAALALFTVVSLAACRDTAQTDAVVDTNTAAGTLPPSMSADSAASRDVALVRVVNAVPASPTLRVRADDQRMMPAVGFQKVSDYVTIDRTWTTFEAGDSASTAFVPLTTDNTLLIDGRRYTLVVLRAENGTGYETRVLTDAIQNVAGRTRLRVVHAAPGAGEIQLRTRGGETLFKSVKYGADEDFSEFAPMSGILDIRTGDGRSVLYSTAPLMLDAGKSYTLVVTRSAAGALGAFWFEDMQAR